MPTPTHGDPAAETTNVPPFSTVNHTLALIPPDAPDHDPDAHTFPTHKRLPSWDGNGILPRAMTTSGGQNYHPSGKRDFTLREYAALQGFPPNHVFAGSYIKKQIGNAVPPVVAKVLFESIKRQLDEVDGVVQGKETMVID
jgi:DNA (cytosine-5)-methyltransferase 1